MLLKLLLGITVLVGVPLNLSFVSDLFKAKPLPKLENEYWGPSGRENNSDVTIRPFKIPLHEKDIEDIKLRLSMTRSLSPPLEDTQTQYGLNPTIMTEVYNHIKHEYNFSRQNEFLNTFPQFKTNIQGLDVYFIHVKPKSYINIKVLPILLLHGWPSSVREFYGMVERMTNVEKERDFVFELIIPSLPGYGYSDGPAKKGCRAHHMGLILKNLMERLDHTQFYVHGSDWGAVVATNMALFFPENILGFHSNFCISLRHVSILKVLIGSLFPSLIFPEGFYDYWYPWTKSLRFLFAESGYLHLMGTKPETIGIGMDSSLETLIAYTFEKYSIGTNKDFIYLNDGGLKNTYNYTLLLDNVLFYYWLPKKATTAARIYAENLNADALFMNDINNTPIDESVPCGCTFFKNEFIYQSENILRDKYTNLIHNTYHDAGGHFIALEKNKELVEDIISFVRKTQDIYSNTVR